MDPAHFDVLSTLTIAHNSLMRFGRFFRCMPPPPPEHDGSYPEDQDREDDENFIDSSLSVNEVFAWITSEAPGDMADSSDDEGINGFDFENTCDPADALKPRFAASSWTRWDGIV